VFFYQRVFVGSDILLKERDLDKGLLAPNPGHEAGIAESVTSLSSNEQLEIQKELASKNVNQETKINSSIDPQKVSAHIDELRDKEESLSGSILSNQLQISAKEAAHILRDPSVDPLTRVKICEKIVGLMDDKIADTKKFSAEELKTLMVESASLRMQVARRAEELVNPERSAKELKLKGVTAALTLSKIPGEQLDERSEALYLQALIAGREIEGTKFKDYLVPEIQALRKEKGSACPDMASLIPEAEERLILRLAGKLEYSKDPEIREFVASVRAQSGPSEIATASQAVMREIEKGLDNSIKGSALELALASEFSGRAITSEMKEARVESLHRQFAAVGLKREELLQKLESEIASQAQAMSQLSPELRYAMNDRVEEAMRSLRKDPSYPSAETLAKAVENFQAGLKPEELAAFNKLLGENKNFSSLIVQSVSVNSRSADSEDMKLVNTYANEARLKRELAAATEVVEKQMGAASKAEKQQVEGILGELKVAVSAGPGNNVWWGSLQTKIEQLKLKADPQGVVKQELGLMLAKAELRSMALIEDNYIDLRTVESDKRVRENFETLGLRGDRLEDAIHSYARGANALYAEREIERLKRDYVLWGDHYYDAKNNSNGLGLGVPGVRYKKGEADVMLQDATLALRAQGYQGQELQKRVGDLVISISERYHADLKVKETTYVARVEELRRHGATAIEITDDPARPFRPIPKHDSLFKDEKELYRAVLDRYAPKWKKELESQGANPESLDSATLKEYCQAVFKDSDLKVDFSDRAAVEKMAHLGGIFTVLRDTGGGRSKSIPYLEDAQKFLRGELPQEPSAKMLVEARAQAAFEYCNKHIADKVKRTADREYQAAGGALGMTIATVGKTGDSIIRGVTADWVSPEAIGKWMAGKIYGENEVARSYDTIDSAYKNLEGVGGAIAHGSEKVGYVAGNAAGVFLGTELLHGTKVASFTVGKVTAMAAAGAAHNMIHKDDRGLTDRLKDGGVAFAQMMILGKGLEFIGSAGAAVNKLPPSVASKLTPLTNALEPMSAVTGRAATAINNGMTNVIGQAGSRIVGGAALNVGIEVPLRMAMGEQVNQETLINAALFGACFEACGVYGQKFGTFRSASIEALPRLSTGQLKELLSKESSEALQRVEAFEAKSRELVQEGKGRLDLSERQVAAEKVIELRAKAEEVIGPSSAQKIIDSVKHPVETAKAAVERVDTQVRDAYEASKKGISDAAQFVKEIPKKSVEVAGESIQRVVEAGKGTYQAVKDIPSKTLEMAKQAPAKAVEIVVETGKAIKDIPGRTVEGIKDVAKSTKDGLQAIGKLPKNLLRLSEIQSLTKGCEGSPQAQKAAENFLEARDRAAKSTDAKTRMENLREMVHQERLIREVKGNARVDAEVRDLMIKMLQRGVTPVESSTTTKSSKEAPLENGTGLKIDDAVFKEIEAAINSEQGIDLDSSSLKSGDTASSADNAPKTEPSKSMESEYAWLEDAFNNAREPNRVVEKSSPKPAVEESRFDPLQEKMDALREHQKLIKDEIKLAKEELKNTFGEYEKLELQKNIETLEHELKLLKREQGRLLKETTSEELKVEDSADIKNEPWTPGKDDGGGVATEAPPKAKTDKAAETQTEVKKEVKTEVKEAAKPEQKTEPKTDESRKVELKPEVKTEPKAETKTEPKTELKPELKPESKAEPKVEPLPESLAEARLQPKPMPSHLSVEPLVATESETVTKQKKGELDGGFGVSSDDQNYGTPFIKNGPVKYSSLKFKPEGIVLPGTERKKRDQREVRYQMSEKKVKSTRVGSEQPLYSKKTEQKGKILFKNAGDEVEKDRSEVDIDVRAEEVEKLEFVREDGD